LLCVIAAAAAAAWAQDDGRSSHHLLFLRNHRHAKLLHGKKRKNDVQFTLFTRRVLRFTLFFKLK